MHPFVQFQLIAYLWTIWYIRFFLVEESNADCLTDDAQQARWDVLMYYCSRRAHLKIKFVSSVLLASLLHTPSQKGHAGWNSFMEWPPLQAALPIWLELPYAVCCVLAIKHLSNVWLLTTITVRHNRNLFFIHWNVLFFIHWNVLTKNFESFFCTGWQLSSDDMHERSMVCMQLGLFGSYLMEPEPHTLHCLTKDGSQRKRVPIVSIASVDSWFIWSYTCFFFTVYS